VGIFSSRTVLITIFLIGVVFSISLFSANKINDTYSKLLDAKLQSDLIGIESDYESKLLGVRDISVLFVGDIMLSRGVEWKIRENNDYRYPFLEVREVLQGADIAFGNLEGPISLRGTNQGSEYSFRADPKVIEGLNFAGFDVLSLANNHILDWGANALNDTIELLSKNSIDTVGAGASYDMANKPVIRKVGNTRIAFLAYTDLYPDSFIATNENSGISDFDLEKIKKVIEELKNNADVIVISIHFGEEYSSEPSQYQINIARSLVDYGADAIVCHHPHVIQETELYKNGFIAYSLGNFVFDQSFSNETKSGLVIRLNIKNKNIIDMEKLEVRISDSFQPTFVNL
jgi:poly-gamma-glutamate capsule biosynthesis protein CapA/YwtB (metallophosphatase superfamily)